MSKNTFRSKAMTAATAALATAALATIATPASAAPSPAEGTINPRAAVDMPDADEMASPSQEQRYFTFVMDSKETRDVVGVEDSLYTGKYYRPSQENVRKCIVERESSGYYTVQGGGGNSYYGAYQMSDALADGATWMMLEEHKDLLGPKEAKRLMAGLRDTPADQWTRYWQDAAFYTIANWDGPNSGIQHWAGGRWHC